MPDQLRRSGHRSRRVGALLSAAVCLLLGTGFESYPVADAGRQPASAPVIPGLVRTEHPPLPATWGETWLVPEPGTRPAEAWRALAQGVKLYEAGSFAAALSALDDARLAASPLGGYAKYYAALSLRQLQRHGEARTRLEAVRAQAGESVLVERATLTLADLLESLGDYGRAAALYDEATRMKLAEPDLALAGLVRTALASGDRARAQAAALSLYYDFPTSSRTTAAVDLVGEARQAAQGAAADDFFKRDLARGERLFSARQWDDARSTFQGLRGSASGDSLELIDLRIAECDHQTGRHRAAMDRLKPYLDSASRKAEAQFYYLMSQRGLGNGSEFVSHAWALAEAFPSSTWSAEALNHLASYFIVADRDDEALVAFAKLVNGYPTSRHAERAAWKLGWARYRDAAYVEAAEVFERGAMSSPRSDYRPAWLFWAGRAREQAGDRASAQARYEVTLTDYRNSYYGRLAAKALAGMGVGPRGAASAAPVAPVSTAVRPPAVAASSGVVTPPNAKLVQALVGIELFGLAEGEVRYAQRVYGNSPQLDATLAWIYGRQGDLRKGIGLMRRTYPQFLTEAADRLPMDVLQVIFPLDYWPLIKRHADAHGLDPYLVAALIAQESTFQADVRSHANAWGLMQIVPATGRRLARAEGIRRFRTSLLTDPETNVRLGTRYFAGMLDDFGGEHFALAGYNAGESRVVKWRAERPGWAREEFIDDIPFPETQNYVKRILGTAEDYRMLYGERGAVPLPVASRKNAAPASKATVSDSRPAKNTKVSSKSSRTSSKTTKSSASSKKTKKSAPPSKSKKPANRSGL